MRQAANDTSFGDPFFHAELARWSLDNTSKDGLRAAPSLTQSESYCRMWAKKQYENFTVVSFLLPRNLRQDFYNVYAYCRWSDNLSDEIQDRDDSLRLLDQWQTMLLRCFPGNSHPTATSSDASITHPVLIALKNTIEKHHLDSAPFTDLLSAFRQDQTQVRYETDDELLDYCRRSANPVGRIILQLAGSNDAERRRLSDEICTGLQLANFCQDMSRDADMGRIYAPKSRWQKHSLKESDIVLNQPLPAKQAMLQEWVTYTYSFFQRGEPLITKVPKWLACDLALFIEGGRAILREIENSNFDVWTDRPKVSKATKLKLFARHLLSRILPVQS